MKKNMKHPKFDLSNGKEINFGEGATRGIAYKDIDSDEKMLICTCKKCGKGFFRPIQIRNANGFSYVMLKCCVCDNISIVSCKLKKIKL